MPSLGRTSGALKRRVDAVTRRRVPTHLRDRLTAPREGAAAELVAAIEASRFADAEAEMQARLARDRSQVVPWLDSHRRLRGAPILEIGSGTGISSVALAEQGAVVVGVDVDDAAIEVARARARAHEVEVTFVVANASDIGEVIADRSTEWVIFWASLEHMTIDERLAALTAAWDALDPGGLLTIIETPNRLWYHDSHTSRLPFFDWLPDDLAFKYARMSDRPGFGDRYRDESPDEVLHFLRRGRGMSFHEVHLAIGDPRDIEVVACLSIDRRRRNPLRRVAWRALRPGRYERHLRSLAPGVPAAWFQPFLYLTLRKR